MDKCSNLSIYAEAYQVAYQCWKVLTATQLTLCFPLESQYTVSLKFSVPFICTDVLNDVLENKVLTGIHVFSPLTPLVKFPQLFQAYLSFS